MCGSLLVHPRPYQTQVLLTLILFSYDVKLTNDFSYCHSGYVAVLNGTGGVQLLLQGANSGDLFGSGNLMATVEGS